MARPRLRKIDPGLDLSGHFRVLAELARPWDPVVFFGRRAPVEVDVGCGKGLFLRTCAPAHLDRDFLGIELAIQYAQFAAAQLAKQNISNAKVLQGDAVRFFAEWLPDNLLAAVHIYFPDPWWKKRHKKRRIMRETFVRDVERVLVSGGTLHFWSDVHEYFQTTLDLLAGCTRLEGPWDESEQPAQHELDYRTHFERRNRLHGAPVYRAVFRKPLAHLGDGQTPRPAGES